MEFPSFGGSDIHVYSPFEWEVTWPRISKIQTWGDVDSVSLKVIKCHRCGILLWDKSLQKGVGWEARSASTEEITPLSVHRSEFPVNQKGMQPLHRSSNHHVESQRPGGASGGGTKPGQSQWPSSLKTMKKPFHAVIRKWPDARLLWRTLRERLRANSCSKWMHSKAFVVNEMSWSLVQGCTLPSHGCGWERLQYSPCCSEHRTVEK